jgi:hypothetical protein
MARKQDTIAPYVNSIGRTPDTGISDYLETPRYSTGYTNLFNCISFVSEAHMLKPYKDRVESTINLLFTLLEFAETNHKELLDIKKKADADIKNRQEFSLAFSLDTSRYEDFIFRGYEYELVPSILTSEDRLLYKSNKPKEYNIKYFNHYKSTIKRHKPKFYLVPGQWEQVIHRLKASNIDMIKIETDSSFHVEAFYIDDYETNNRPFEGHYLHKNVKLKSTEFNYKAKSGDFLIPTGTSNDYFLMSVLEPDAMDSYFTWNFFDEILGRKEYFSPYVFEEKAIEILDRNPELKKEYNSKIKDFKSRWEALDYIYRHSNMYEQTHNLHPVFRIH